MHSRYSIVGIQNYCIFVSAARIRVDPHTKRHLLSRIGVDILPYPEGEYMTPDTYMNRKIRKFRTDEFDT